MPGHTRDAPGPGPGGTLLGPMLVHAGLVTVALRGVRLVAVAGMVVAGSCGGAAKAPTVRTFVPGEVVSENHFVRVQLVMATHEPRRIVLRLEIANRGAVPLVIAREGLLFGYEELEYPVEPHDLPLVLEVGPGTTRTLEVAVRVGQPLSHAGTFRLRSVKVRERFIEGLAFVVPEPSAETRKR